MCQRVDMSWNHTCALCGTDLIGVSSSPTFGPDDDASKDGTNTSATRPCLTEESRSNAADGKGGFHPSGPLAPSSSRRGSQTEPGGTTRRSSSSASSWGTSIMGIFLISASELMCMFPRWCTSCLNRTSQVILKPSELSRKALRSSGSLKGELASSQA